MLCSSIKRVVSTQSVKSVLSKTLVRNLNVKRLVFSSHGDPHKVLRLEETKFPDTLKDDEVLVEWFGSTINKGDIAHILGEFHHAKAPSPSGGNSVVAGSEGSGTVMKVGKNVKKLKPNDKVFPANLFLGTWSTHVMGKETDFVVAKEAIRLEYLAQLAPVLVANQILTDFAPSPQGFQKGDTIIQNASSEPIGFAIAQLAFHKGLKSINLLHHENKHTFNFLAARLKKLGGYLVVPYEYTESYKFKSLISDLPKPKLGINGSGGPSVAEIARTLQSGGTLVTYGAENSKPVTVPTSSFLMNDITMRGFWFPRWIEQKSHEQKQEAFDKAIRDMEKTTLFSGVFLLEDFTRALDLFYRKKNVDRVMMTSQLLERLDVPNF